MSDHQIATKQIIKSVSYNLPVLDIEKAGEWYAKHLGFEYIEPKGGEMKLPDGTWISFFTPDTDEDSMWYIGGEISQYRVGIVFRVQDLDQLHNDFKNAGVRVTDIGGQNSSCGRFFDFYDLNGLKLGAWEGYLESNRYYPAQSC